MKLLWFWYWKPQDLINTTLKWGILFEFWAYKHENRSNFTISVLPEQLRAVHPADDSTYLGK